MRFLNANHILTGIKSVFILFVFSSFIQAKNSFNRPQNLYQNGASVGITYEFARNNLFIIIDQKKLLKTIPKLQKAGLIDPNLTEAEISFYQPLLAATVSIGYVTNIVKNIYLTHPNIDQINVDAYLFSSDLYGNNEKAYCYSFNFDRELYQKINWEKFQTDNLKLIAPNFRTSNLCRNLIGINPTSI